MEKIAKIIASGMLLYFLALSFYILHSNIPLTFSGTGLNDQKDIVEFLRRYPFSGKWVSNSTTNSTLKNSEGKLDVMFSSAQTTKGSDSSKENKVLRLIIYDPQFSDEPSIELWIHSDQIGDTQFLGSISGTFSGLQHSGFSCATLSTFQVKLTETSSGHAYSKNVFRIDALTKGQLVFTADLLLSRETSQIFKLEFSFSGYSNAIQLLLYSVICVILLGFNLYSSTNLLGHFLADSNYANLISVHTAYLTICQQSFLFVFHVVVGISLNNNAFIMISVISGAIVLINIWMFILGWNSAGFEEAEQTATTQRSLQKLFLEKVMLTTCGLLSIYCNMRYFLEPWTLGLNACVLIPQIVHNIRTRIPAHFSVKFMIGFASSPLLIFIYLRSCKLNPFQIRYGSAWPFFILAAWVFMILLIKLQNLFHSQAILPFFMRSDCHRYFIRKVVFGSGQLLTQRSLGSSEELSLKTVSSICDINTSNCRPEEMCSVCQDRLLENPPKISINKESENSAPKNGSLCKKYPRNIFHDYLMSTPCNHHFHSECLLAWMQVKMACPVCRCDLPPLE